MGNSQDGDKNESTLGCKLGGHAETRPQTRMLQSLWFTRAKGATYTVDSLTVTPAQMQWQDSNSWPGTLWQAEMQVPRIWADTFHHVVPVAWLGRSVEQGSLSGPPAPVPVLLSALVTALSVSCLSDLPGCADPLHSHTSASMVCYS